ncbi:MAG: choice-of-anchor B family protein, partial [Planctomycetota bacterium]
MRMLNLARAAVLLSVCLPAVWAHDDDPKILDREPRYEGPGYRAALRDNAPVFASSNVTLLSWLTVGELSSGAANANDCWGYVSPSGREYAIIGVSDATVFVEITDPANATIVASLSGPSSLWRDIKVYQDFAYSVSEGGGGIQVFDMSQIDNGVVTLVNTITSGGTSATHNVAINTDSGYLYRCGGGNNGLRIYRLNNPAFPQYVKSWSDKYVHDVHVTTYTSGPYAGREIAFASGGFNGGNQNTGVDILDVTDKNNIFTISRIQWSERGYSHQCWLSPDKTVLYINDELDEQTYVKPTTTHFFDVSNLEYPKELGTFTSGSTAIDHNLYTRDTLVFEANYRSGLHVFDATDPTNPVEVAYFDTYPFNDAAQFNGLWSNYPYFPSGTVIGSDIERGLFVWRIDVPLSIRLLDARPEQVNRAGGDTLDVEVIENNPGAFAGGSVTLHYDYGFGTQSVAAEWLGGNTFRITFPPVPCNSTIQWYVTADASDGVSASSPVAAPTTTYTAFAPGDPTIVIADDMEAAGGWTVDFNTGSDTATTGVWEHGDPIGTIAQPEDDHSASGVNCWFTGNAPRGSLDSENEVDHGRTTLTSPAYDLSGYDEPMIGFWLWFSNDKGLNPQTDSLLVRLSTDDGATWPIIAEEVGPDGIETTGGWTYHTIR